MDNPLIYYKKARKYWYIYVFGDKYLSADNEKDAKYIVDCLKYSFQKNTDMVQSICRRMYQK